MAEKADKYTYRVTWSEEDTEHVGLCVEFPSLSWLAASPEAALKGIRKLVAEVVDDMVLPDFEVAEAEPIGGDSDHTSFNNNGYMGIFPFEDTPNYSPYIHTGQDKIGPSVNSPEMAKTFIQANLACLASLAIPYDSTVGINPRPGIVSEVRVFPNPANDVISVSNTKGKTMQVKLTSTAGQALTRTRIKGQGLVDVSFLTPGIYFIQCTGDDFAETVRFIKK